MNPFVLNLLLIHKIYMLQIPIRIAMIIYYFCGMNYSVFRFCKCGTQKDETLTVVINNHSLCFPFQRSLLLLMWHKTCNMSAPITTFGLGPVMSRPVGTLQRRERKWATFQQMLIIYNLKRPYYAIWGFLFPVVCCKWSAKAKICVFPPEGVSLPHSPPAWNASIGLLCLLP